MEIRLIECDKIDFPATDQGGRDTNCRAAQAIADGIKAERTSHPIVVRPDPDKPAHFLGVHGRHRLYAKQILLEEPLIECVVLAMDDEEAGMAAATANFYRHESSPAGKIRSIKRWHEHFRAKHPELVGKGKAGGAARKRKARDGKEAKAELAFASRDEGGNGRAKTEGAGGGPAWNFTKRLAAATGVSETTAKREVRLASGLTDDQLDLCQWMKLKKGQIASIAGAKDGSRWGRVVALLDGGRGFDDAWREVYPSAKKAVGRSREQKAAGAAIEQERPPCVSDDEWFDQACGAKAARLARPVSYRADALAYRRLSENRHLFLGKAQANREDDGVAVDSGPFCNAVGRLISLNHPKDWPLCGRCDGRGVVEAGGPCSSCSGAGYLLKTAQAVTTFVAEKEFDARFDEPLQEQDLRADRSIAPFKAMFASLGQ